jgi:hypothetical protein
MRAGEDLQAARRRKNQAGFAAYEIESALTNPSDAYQAGYRASRAASYQYGTVNLTPSIALHDEWAHAWGEFMRGWNAAKKAKNPGKKNPADLAAEAFELFHGFPPESEIVFESIEHEHEVYAGIGELMELVVVPRGEKKGILLHGFKSAMLCMNERGIIQGQPAQLYIVGGDQSLDSRTLRQFGVEGTHEQEVLGTCVDITYFTDKTHLGRDGGEADYVHAFGEESAKRKMRILVSPTATYHTINKIIGLWGGKYTIEPEGIRN